MNDNKTIGKIKSPSKINLYLKVTGKRDDGYHEIESLFVPLLEPSDEITISESVTAGIIIDSDSKDIPLDETNVCYKAAAEFAKFADMEPRWHIHIKKNIPVSAGLGGGSSDAAAVLKILNDNVKQIDDPDLKNIAAGIGADVPFFLNPIPSIGKGIGEILNPVQLEVLLDIVLVNPLFPVSAKWGYGALGTRPETRGPESRLRPGRSYAGQADNTEYGIDELIETLNSGGIPESIVNDLAPAVFEKFPIMGILSDRMKELGADCVGMSGSGPTLFAICKSPSMELRAGCETAANPLRQSSGQVAEKILDEYGSAIWMAETAIC